MVRRAALLIAALLLLIAAIAGALYLGRVPVAQALLDSRLSGLGLPEARATVVEVEFDRFRLRDLRAGGDGEFAAEELRVGFRLADLRDGNVARIEVEGLALRLDLREGAAPFGSLQAFKDRMAARPGAARGASVPLPEIRVADALIRAETPFGPASLAVDGTVTYHDPRIATTSFELVLDTPFGRLEARLDAAGDPRLRMEGGLEILGRDLELPVAAARVSSLTGRAGLTVTNGRPRFGQARLLFSGLSLGGRDFQGAEVEVELSETRAAARGHLLEDHGSFSLDFDGALEGLREEPRLNLTLKSEIFERSALWTLAPPAWPNGGGGRLSATIEGDFAPRAPLPGDPPSLMAWLGESALKAVFEIDLRRLGFDTPNLDLAARLRGTADWSEGRLEVSLAEDGVLRATAHATALASGDLATDDLATDGLTDGLAASLAAGGLSAPLAEDLASLAGGGLSVDLAAEGGRPARAVLRPGALTVEGSVELTGERLNAAATGELSFAIAETRALDRIALDAFSLEAREFSLAGQTFAEFGLEGRLQGGPDDLEARTDLRVRLRRPALGDWRAEDARLSMVLRIARSKGRLEAVLEAPGEVVAEGLRGPGGLEAVGPLKIAIEEAVLALEPADNETADDEDADDEDAAASPVFRHHGRLAAAPALFRLLRAGAEPMTIGARLPEISWTAEGRKGAGPGMEARLANGRIDLPDRKIALDGLAATARVARDGTGATADFIVAAIRHLGDPPAFAPLSLSGRALHDGKTIELAAEARGPGDLGRVEIAGRHDIATGAGTLDIELRPLSFSPDGSQPGELLPLLSELSQVRGAAAGQARLRWDAQGAVATADLSLDALSFRSGDTAVEGLDLALRLAPLWPPASPAGQRLSIEAIDAALPLRDLAVSFSLPPGPFGRVLLEEAGFAAAGARFAVRETLIDPAADRIRARLLVDDLELTELFKTLAVEGLSGEGRLSGAIPVALEDGGLTIEEARLSSMAPGHLRFASDAAARALRSGGEYVELMLRALENFQYDSLVLSADLGADKEARVRLEMLGRNPDVLDGHPFQINVNLTGNVGPLAEALRQGRAITRDLLRRSWRLAP